ncbi:MAG: sporulation protein YunB, partial [Eubacteriales bacterium]|nr:sporulation protein YunB [Eubacteriales bacterium]
IPIGSVLGSQLLSGRGPLIYVRIIPVGSVITIFNTEFENAGINQTRYRIIMNADTSVRIVMPGGGQKVEISAEIPVAEAIIVGDVPGSFVQVDDTSKLDIAQAVE